MFVIYKNAPHGKTNSFVIEQYGVTLSRMLRYFVPQVPITGKMLNGYLMFSVKNIV